MQIVGIAGGVAQWNFFTNPYEATLTNSYWGTIEDLHEVVQLYQAGQIIPTSSGSRSTLPSRPTADSATASSTPAPSSFPTASHRSVLRHRPARAGSEGQNGQSAGTMPSQPQLDGYLGGRWASCASAPGARMSRRWPTGSTSTASSCGWRRATRTPTRPRAGSLCKRHADAMVVPRGWTLDDRAGADAAPVPPRRDADDAAPAAPAAASRAAGAAADVPAEPRRDQLALVERRRRRRSSSREARRSPRSPASRRRRRPRRHPGDPVAADVRRATTTSTACCRPAARCWPGRSGAPTASAEAPMQTDGLPVHRRCHRGRRVRAVGVARPLPGVDAPRPPRRTARARRRPAGVAGRAAGPGRPVRPLEAAADGAHRPRAGRIASGSSASRTTSATTPRGC